MQIAAVSKHFRRVIKGPMSQGVCETPHQLSKLCSPLRRVEGEEQIRNALINTCNCLVYRRKTNRELDMYIAL